MKAFSIDGSAKLAELETTLNGAEEYGWRLVSLVAGASETLDDKGKPSPVNIATLERKRWGNSRPELALEIIDDAADFGTTIGARAADGWVLQIGPSAVFVRSERVDVAVFRKDPS